MQARGPGTQTTTSVRPLTGIVVADELPMPPSRNPIPPLYRTAYDKARREGNETEEEIAEFMRRELPSTKPEGLREQRIQRTIKEAFSRAPAPVLTAPGPPPPPVGTDLGQGEGARARSDSTLALPSLSENIPPFPESISSVVKKFTPSLEEALKKARAIKAAQEAKRALKAAQSAPFNIVINTMENKPKNTRAPVLAPTPAPVLPSTPAPVLPSTPMPALERVSIRATQAINAARSLLSIANEILAVPRRAGPEALVEVQTYADERLHLASIEVILPQLSSIRREMNDLRDSEPLSDEENRTLYDLVEEVGDALQRSSAFYTETMRRIQEYDARRVEVEEQNDKRVEKMLERFPNGTVKQVLKQKGEDKVETPFAEVTIPTEFSHGSTGSPTLLEVIHQIHNLSVRGYEDDSFSFNDITSHVMALLALLSLIETRIRTHGSEDRVAVRLIQRLRYLSQYQYGGIEGTDHSRIFLSYGPQREMFPRRNTLFIDPVVAEFLAVEVDPSLFGFLFPSVLTSMTDMNLFLQGRIVSFLYRTNLSQYLDMRSFVLSLYKRFRSYTGGNDPSVLAMYSIFLPTAPVQTEMTTLVTELDRIFKEHAANTRNYTGWEIWTLGEKGFFLVSTALQLFGDVSKYANRFQFQQGVSGQGTMVPFSNARLGAPASSFLSAPATSFLGAPATASLGAPATSFLGAPATSFLNAPAAETGLWGVPALAPETGTLGIPTRKEFPRGFPVEESAKERSAEVSRISKQQAEYQARIAEAMRPFAPGFQTGRESGSTPNNRREAEERAAETGLWGVPALAPETGTLGVPTRKEFPRGFPVEESAKERSAEVSRISKQQAEYQARIAEAMRPFAPGFQTERESGSTPNNRREAQERAAEGERVAEAAAAKALAEYRNIAEAMRPFAPGFQIGRESGSTPNNRREAQERAAEGERVAEAAAERVVAAQLAEEAERLADAEAERLAAEAERLFYEERAAEAERAWKAQQEAIEAERLAAEERLAAAEREAAEAERLAAAEREAAEAERLAAAEREAAEAGKATKGRDRLAAILKKGDNALAELKRKNEEIMAARGKRVADAEEAAANAGRNLERARAESAAIWERFGASLEASIAEAARPFVLPSTRLATPPSPPAEAGLVQGEGAPLAPVSTAPGPPPPPPPVGTDLGQGEGEGRLPAESEGAPAKPTGSAPLPPGPAPQPTAPPTGPNYGLGVRIIGNSVLRRSTQYTQNLAQRDEATLSRAESERYKKCSLGSGSRGTQEMPRFCMVGDPVGMALWGWAGYEDQATRVSKNKETVKGVVKASAETVVAAVSAAENAWDKASKGEGSIGDAQRSTTAADAAVDAHEAVLTNVLLFPEIVGAGNPTQVEEYLRGDPATNAATLDRARGDVASMQQARQTLQAIGQVAQTALAIGSGVFAGDFNQQMQRQNQREIDPDVNYATRVPRNTQLPEGTQVLSAEGENIVVVLPGRNVAQLFASAAQVGLPSGTQARIRPHAWIGTAGEAAAFVRDPALAEVSSSLYPTTYLHQGPGDIYAYHLPGAQPLVPALRGQGIDLATANQYNIRGILDAPFVAGGGHVRQYGDPAEAAIKAGARFGQFSRTGLDPMNRLQSGYFPIDDTGLRALGLAAGAGAGAGSGAGAEAPASFPRVQPAPRGTSFISEEPPKGGERKRFRKTRSQKKSNRKTRSQKKSNQNTRRMKGGYLPAKVDPMIHRIWQLRSYAPFRIAEMKLKLTVQVLRELFQVMKSKRV